MWVPKRPEIAMDRIPLCLDKWLKAAAGEGPRWDLQVNALGGRAMEGGIAEQVVGFARC